MAEIKRVTRWREMIIWEHEKEEEKEWREVNHAFSCQGYCKLLLFALVAIWRMDWDGFRMDGLLWDVTSAGVNWEPVYLTWSALLKNPLIGNDGLLIGFLQTPLSPTQFKAISLPLCMCLSRTLSCLVSLITQVNFLFSLSLPLFNLGAVVEWWVFICLESLSIPLSMSVSLIFKSVVI